jgi:hypothetical protein
MDTDNRAILWQKGCHWKVNRIALTQISGFLASSVWEDANGAN